jgi:hypothetical protein
MTPHLTIEQAAALHYLGFAAGSFVLLWLGNRLENKHKRLSRKAEELYALESRLRAMRNVALPLPEGEFYVHRDNLWKAVRFDHENPPIGFVPNPDGVQDPDGIWGKVETTDQYGHTFSIMARDNIVLLYHDVFLVAAEHVDAFVDRYVSAKIRHPVEHQED